MSLAEVMVVLAIVVMIAVGGYSFRQQSLSRAEILSEYDEVSSLAMSFRRQYCSSLPSEIDLMSLAQTLGQTTSVESPDAWRVRYSDHLTLLEYETSDAVMSNALLANIVSSSLSDEGDMVILPVKSLGVSEGATQFFQVLVEGGSCF